MAKEKMLSVIIPVHNGEQYLEKSLPAICSSDYPNYEVIVVDDASTDNSATLAKKFSCSVIELKENKGQANARNKGAEAAKGDILVFFDADIVVEKDTLSKFAAAHQNPEVKICQSQVDAKSINKGFSRDLLATIWNYQLTQMAPHPTFLSTMSCSIEKKVFEEIGGFNTQFRGAGGEEFEIGPVLQQHDYKIHLDQSISVHHHFQSFWSRCRTLFKRSAIYSRLVFNKRFRLNKGNGTPAQGTNAVLATAGITALALTPFFNVAVFVFGGSILAHLMIDRKMYAHIAKSRNRVFAIAAIPAIYMWYMIMGLGTAKAAITFPLEKAKSIITWPSFLLSKTPPYIIFFVNSICNARCKHCFINWDDTKALSTPALSLEEIKKISKSFGKVKYLTLTGGEPSLRKDIAEIAQTFYENNKLENLNYITNGFSTEKLLKDVKTILRNCPNLNMQLNFSVDAIGKKHDEIRVVKNGFNRLLQSVEKVRALKKHYPKLYMGIITTYSKFNKDNIYEVIDYVIDGMKLPMYLNYVRGDTYDKSAKEVDIGKYNEASKVVAAKNMELTKRKVPRAIDVLNNLTPKVIDKVAKENKFVLPCRVGTKLIEIGHDGIIFPCEILSDKFGNIKDFGYDIKKVLAMKKAKEFSKRIIKTKCKCTWECAIKNNIIYTPKKYPSIVSEWTSLLLKRKQPGKRSFESPQQDTAMQRVQLPTK